MSPATTNRKIARASFALIIISAFGALLSLWKEMLTAKYFGIARSMDVFYAALSIVNYPASIFIALIASVFIPLYLRIKYRNGTLEANRFASILINYAIVICISLAAFCMLFSKEIMQLNFNAFDGKSIAASSGILMVISMTILFSAMVTILTGILNASESFFWPAVSQMLVTVSNIIFIITFSRRWGIYVFAWGLFAGLFAHCVVLVFWARKTGYRHRLDFDFRHPGIADFMGPASLALLSALMGGFVPYFNRVVASWLPEGSIAAFAYAEKIFSFPSLIFTTSIATAIFPFFALQAAEKKIDELKYSVASSIKMSAFIFIPVTITLVIFAQPLVRLLFQRGAFDTRAAGLTSIILIFLSLQLFSHYMLVIFQRVLYSFHDMRSVLVISAFTTVLNVFLNIVLIRYFDPPVAGIALASSLASFASTFLYFYVLKKRLTFLHGLSILKSILIFFMVASAAGGIMYLIYHSFDRILNYSFAFQAVKLAFSVTLGLAAYVILAFMMKTEEIEKAYAMIKGRIQRYV